MTHDLRRLRLHGLIERLPRSHRYRVTKIGTLTALFYVRFYARALRPSFSLSLDSPNAKRSTIPLTQLEQAVGKLLEEVHLAA
jgi:hypothetical protein